MTSTETNDTAQATGIKHAVEAVTRKAAPARSLCLTTFAVFIALIFAPSRNVLAHAILMSSSPAANATVSGAELDIVLRFNSRIDASRSLLILALPDGKTQPMTLLKSAAPEVMEAKAFHLPAGRYALRWQALASDGHISRGEIPFNIRNGN